MNKLRILLVDDQPTGVWSHKGYPHLTEPWASFFTLHWVQNAREGRWLLDVFSELNARYPEALGSVGLA